MQNLSFWWSNDLFKDNLLFLKGDTWEKGNSDLKFIQQYIHVEPLNTHSVHSNSSCTDEDTGTCPLTM